MIYHQTFCDNKLLENSQNSRNSAIKTSLITRIYCTQKKELREEYSFLRVKRLLMTRVLQTMGTHAFYAV